MKTVKDAYEKGVNNECCENTRENQVILCCVRYSNDDKGEFKVGHFYTGSSGVIKDCFYQVCTRKEFEDYAKMQKLNSINKEAVKPVYTQEMADNGELPPVGSWVHFNGCNVLIVGFTSKGFPVFERDNGYVDSFVGKSNYKPIDTRTDKEKLIDDLIQGAALTSSMDKELIGKILDPYEVKEKSGD